MAVGRELIDAMEALLGLLPLRQTVGRVREVDGAIRAHDEVVGAIELLAVERGRQGLELPLAEGLADPTGTMLAEQEVALGVDGQAVGALEIGRLIRTAGLQEDGRGSLATLPGVGGVLRDVRKDEAVLVPHGAFRPTITGADFFNFHIGRDQGVQRRVELVDTGSGDIRGQSGGSEQQKRGEGFHGGKWIDYFFSTLR